MSSGNKRVVFNTNERVVSPDQNRHQRIGAANMAEIMRYAISATGDEDLDVGSVMALPTSLGTPLDCEIINGSLVRPDAGSFSLSVDPGVAMMLQPDAGPDDSDYKIVKDPGLVMGGLVVGANGSGSTRIDVVEFRMSAVPVQVNESRDIYNQPSNLFAAVSVVKTENEVFEWRVRQGTPGAGMPVNAAGWTPACVVMVPNAAASLNTCTLWDVRPLLWDRQYGISGLANNAYPEERIYEGRHVPNGTGLGTFTGMARGVYRGRRIGGFMRRGSPGVDGFNIDLSDAANHDANVPITFPYTGNMYIYLLFPNNLPRWARYTDGPVGRVPRSPRGIPVLSYKHPEEDGTPLTTVDIPGFGPSIEGQLAYVLTILNTGAAAAATYVEDTHEYTILDKGLAVNPHSSSVQDFIFKMANSFVDNTGIPYGTRAVRVTFITNYNIAAAGVQSWFDVIEVFPNDTGAGVPLQIGRNQVIYTSVGATSFAIRNDVWVPVPLLFSSAFSQFMVRRRMLIFSGAITSTVAGANYEITGYRR